MTGSRPLSLAGGLGAAALAALAVAAALLPPGRADAAVATYRWQVSSGATVGGVATNWGTCNSSRTVTSQVATTMNKNAFGCAQDRLTDTAASPANMLLLVSDAPYVQATRVTGQASGNVWTLQNAGGAGTVIFGFQLGYVSGGTFTQFAGQVNQTVTTSQTTYSPNLSALTGTLPAGAFLALRIVLQQNQAGTQARIYFASAGNGSGALAVDETAAGTLTLGNNSGAEAPPQTICANSTTAADLDLFTLQATAADTVSNVTFTFGGASAASSSAAIATLQLTNDAGTAIGSAVASPAPTTTVALNLAAPTVATQYRAKITPNAAAAAGIYTFTGTVTTLSDTGGFTKAGSDGSSATITIDAQAQNDVSAVGAGAAGATAVNVSWTNPTSDFASVLVVRRTGAAPTGTPARGQTYAAGAALPGAGANETVVLASGSAISFADAGLAPGTTYFYGLFVRDPCGNWSGGVQTAATTQSQALTIADGAAPAGGTICPGDTLTRDLAAFTIGTSPGVTDTVTGLTLDFTSGGANPGAAQAIGAASITDAAGTRTFASAAAPGSSASFAFTAPDIAATSSAAPYRVRFSAGPHTMAAGSWNVTAVVTGATHANAANALAVSTSAAGSATFVVDNQPPPAPSGVVATPGDGQVQLAWTNPSADFGGYVVVVAAAGAATLSGVPLEGTATYLTGAPIGNGTVVCQGNITSCTRTGLTNGTAYSFAVFARDACSNWSSAASATATPATNAAATGIPTATASACNQVTISAPFTGDLNNDSTVTVVRDVSPTGAFATTVCGPGAGGTGNPRSCVDTTTAGTTGYYYRVTFADPDGVAGANPRFTTLVTTPVCATNLVLGAPGPQPAGSLVAGGGAVLVGQVSLAAASGTIALASLGVANGAAASAATPGTDLQALTLGDASGNVLGVSRWNGSRYVFTWPVDPVTKQAYQIGTAAVTLNVYATAAYGAAAGRAFQMSVAAADVVGAPSAGGGNVAATTGGPVAGSTFTIAAPAAIAEGDRTAGSTKPGVAIWNPGKGTVVSGDFLLQVLVSSPTVNGAGDVTAVGFATNGAAPCAATAGLARQPNYDGKVGTNAALWQKVLRFGAGGDFPAEGAYTLVACATNASGTVSSAPVSITVRKPGTGDGNLLVRDNSSQLCQDCHALQTHSSGNVSNKYGSWTVNCRDCHDPHKTRNIFLVREQITPPAAAGTYQPSQPVYFANKNGDSSAVGPGGGAAAPGNSSYVNADNSGPCQVCHTRTSSADGTKARWRNSGSGGNADAHNVGLNDTTGSGGCTGCHSHQTGFKPGESQGGSACASCHGGIWTAMTSAATASKHSLVGAQNTATDNGTAWDAAATLGAIAPAQRSCVSMCHGDHPHNTTTPAGTTHEYNLYADPSNATTRANGSAVRTTASRTSVDFDPLARTGPCTTCHAKPIDAARPAVTAAGFGASAHNFTSTAAPAASWEYVLHDGSKVQRNCTKCHASRAEGATPSFSGTGLGAVHGSSDPSLLAGAKNPAAAVNTTPPASFVCYNCHGNGTTAGANFSGKDLWTATQKTYFHPVNQDARHDSAAEAAATWNSGVLSGANRHANCQDCHDPHGAVKGLVNRAATADVNRNKVPPALTGAKGVSYTSYPPLPATACGGSPALPTACFTTTSTANFGASLVTATYEYEVCFKCHSSFAFGNTTYPTAPATGASGQLETDVAAEFSPNSRSGHPVVTGLASYAGSVAPKSLVTAQLLAPWNVNVGTQTMLCSDCHNTDAASPAAQGPHGSAVPFMLTGANRAWPYTAAGATGTNRTLSTSETNLGTANGLFCRNCHPQQSSSSSNWIHQRANGQHGSDTTVGACVGCHIRVPHGGKVSRLIVTTNAPARYKVGTPNLASFGKAAGKDSYSMTNVRSSCSQHSGGTGGEAW